MRQDDKSYLNAKGWLTVAERNALFKYASAAPVDGTIINVGVEYGASVKCLRAGNESARIYAIDIDLSPKEVDDKVATFIEGDSYEIVQKWPQLVKQRDYWFDLVFIDGDHSYQGVKRDIAYASMVKTGGIIMFHDCFDWPPAPPRTVRPPCPEVNKAVQEWYSRNYTLWTELPEVDSIRIFRRVNNGKEK